MRLMNMQKRSGHCVLKMPMGILGVAGILELSAWASYNRQLFVMVSAKPIDSKCSPVLKINFSGAFVSTKLIVACMNLF